MTTTKDEAMARVERNADDDWMTQAYTCVIGCAVRNAEFTTDHVWARLTELWRAKTHEPRAMGAVMRRAARDGAITKTDRVRPSTWHRNNQRPVAVWESLLYQHPTPTAIKLVTGPHILITKDGVYTKDGGPR